MKALIVGGSRGFGEEISNELKKKGFSVVTVGRSNNPDFVCDIGDLEQWQRTIQDIKSAHANFDLIIFVAGFARGISAKDLTIENWYEHLNKNLIYVALGIEAFKDTLNPGGKVITIGSQWSYKMGSDELVAYTVAKHALDTLTKDFATRNPSIKVNHYCVPTMNTAQEKEVEKSFEKINKTFAPKRIAVSENIAASLANHIVSNSETCKTLNIDTDGIISSIN
jgi:NAD(P)-dependent dehydrogenase (short-subunit alcohol dehydrogenase family)